MREKVIENKIKETLNTLKRNGKPIWFFKHAASPAMKKGIPDIIACIKGYFIGIEVKRDENKGKQSDEQKVCEENIQFALGEYWLVESYEEFIEKYNDFARRKKNVNNGR